ncbi:MAG TPA: hypothetical protein VK470_01420 [Bacteroidota bacterium]|nr:hypothetical protein [Bacteroidota bacterium]
MGTQTIIDIIASTIVFGALMLMTLRMNTAQSEMMQTARGDLMVQESIVQVAHLIEYDFRKMGYCRNTAQLLTDFILVADSNRITFRTDVNNDGHIDTMRYYLGPTSELASTPNPRDRILYRVINSDDAKGANLGVTVFDLRYYDQFRQLMAFPITGSALNTIKEIQITVQVENITASSLSGGSFSGYSAPFGSQYSGAYWRQMRLSSRNLTKR